MVGQRHRSGSAHESNAGSMGHDRRQRKLHNFPAALVADRDETAIMDQTGLLVRDAMRDEIAVVPRFGIVGAFMAVDIVR